LLAATVAPSGMVWRMARAAAACACGRSVAGWASEPSGRTFGAARVPISASARVG